MLALDYGSARCGAALSDPTGTLATPIEPVLRADTRKGLRRVVELVQSSGAELVVVGLPLSLSGADSEQTERSREFAERLRRQVRVPVELMDERFTTKLARDLGGDSAEDSRAAAVLLDGWLAARGGRSQSPDGYPG
ncbi:MAG: Putative Holliday junction resolvase YggF [uncultured Solirubrobacteraceae bacterium]|uniref:Putative pre-16S rRNA nuclease n=1 Tax=uncultured Solirubrobacteraceae bacterium TaxID=1162706 RepID=A0A6J4RQL4_9ACTN|nr:MAG: Putative Holliday junction resolvase YggF [uncultured Solirubrobacteraceae bacterium]